MMNLGPRVKHILLISLQRLKMMVQGIYGPRNASLLPAMPEILKHFGNRSLVIAEIGARYGESSEMLLKSLRVHCYFVVDPYECYEGYENDGFFSVLSAVGGDKIFQETKEKLGRLNPNVRFLRNYSHDPEVTSSIKANSLDLIFIDGNHEFDFVLRDLQIYWKLLRPGGLLLGDDFHLRSKQKHVTSPYYRPMVFEAVEQFSQEIGRSYKTFGAHAGFPKVFMFLK